VSSPYTIGSSNSDRMLLVVEAKAIGNLRSTTMPRSITFDVLCVCCLPASILVADRSDAA